MKTNSTTIRLLSFNPNSPSFDSYPPDKLAGKVGSMGLQNIKVHWRGRLSGDMEIISYINDNGDSLNPARMERLNGLDLIKQTIKHKENPGAYPSYQPDHPNERQEMVDLGKAAGLIPKSLDLGGLNLREEMP